MLFFLKSPSKNSDCDAIFLNETLSQSELPLGDLYYTFFVLYFVPTVAKNCLNLYSIHLNFSSLFILIYIPNELTYCFSVN